MLKNKTNLQKILNESRKAVSTVLKNREVIEILISMQEIKSGKYKKAFSAEGMFKQIGI